MFYEKLENIKISIPTHALLELAYILCEENENINKHGKIPVCPAASSIEKIVIDVRH
jgi:hypothetical protein